MAFLKFSGNAPKRFSPGGVLPTETDSRAPGHVRCHAGTRPTGSLTTVKRRAASATRQGDASTAAGGTERDGAADFGHAGVHRLHLRDLHDESYRVDKVSHPGAAGILAGDESLRRPSDGDVATAS